MPRCWDVGMQGCMDEGLLGWKSVRVLEARMVEYEGTGMQGSWGGEVLGVQRVGTPGCREMEIGGDAGMRGCRHTRA